MITEKTTTTTKTKAPEFRLRREVEDIPHTDAVDILIPEDGTYIEVYSGHVPLVLQTFTILFSVMQPEERALLWSVTFEIIEEIARDEGWFYQNEHLVRDFDFFTESGEALQQHEDSANRVFDRIWLLKDYLQEHGVKKYFENCSKLADDNEDEIATVREEYIAYKILQA